MIAWIRAGTFERMRDEAHRQLPLETGGVLLGYWSQDRQSLLISDASGPGPGATHGVSDFTPDPAFQRNFVARAYEDSRRITTYLGDWHSHPGGADQLSQTDLHTLGRIARDRHARARHPIMAILSGNEPQWSLTVWVLNSVGWLLRPHPRITRAAVRLCD